MNAPLRFFLSSRRTPVLAAALLAAMVCQLPGQGLRQPAGGNQDDAPNTSRTEEELPKKFWEATIPGGNYLIALSSITFVSIHEYVVDGNIRVNEVTIGSDSDALARFYWLEPLADAAPVAAVQGLTGLAGNVAESVASRTGSEEVWKKVVKNYPATTHAHTVEYRLEYLGDLQALYGSVKGAWYNGVGTKFQIVNEEK